MAEVMIRCPITEELVPTHIGIPFDEFEDLEADEFTLDDCPACGEDHTWTKGDALPDE